MRFIFVFSGVFFVLAGFSARADEIVFRRKNTMGLTRVDKLEHDDDIFKFNGKVLGNDSDKASKDQLIMAFHDFSKAVEIPHKHETCASGTYIYLKKQMGEQSTYEGCTEGAVYREITQRLEKIRQWSLAKGPQ